jgi:hypothetical protein
LRPVGWMPLKIRFTAVNLAAPSHGSGGSRSWCAGVKKPR